MASNLESLMSATGPKTAATLERSLQGRDLGEEQVEHLFSVNGVDLLALFMAADQLRRETVGELVTYVVNRNINYTNICTFRCGFCAFSKGKMSENLRGKPYDLKLEEIVLDCDIVYVGDARVIFTLQGISAQIKDIKFRGMARVHLKPLLNRFPFVGGFEMYFLSMPTLEYGLGGIGTFGEVPGINGIVRHVVEDVVRSRFVWPSRFKLYFPLEDLKHQSKASYMLPTPAGLLTVTIKEARDLLKKDKHIGGSGKSDPYAVVSIG